MGWTCYINPVCAGKTVGRTLGRARKLARHAAASSKGQQNVDPEKARQAFIDLMALTGAIGTPGGFGAVINAAVAETMINAVEEGAERQVKKLKKTINKLKFW